MLAAVARFINLALHLTDPVWIGRQLGIPGVMLILLSFNHSLRKRGMIKSRQPDASAVITRMAGLDRLRDVAMDIRLLRKALPRQRAKPGRHLIRAAHGIQEPFAWTVGQVDFDEAPPAAVVHGAGVSLAEELVRWQRASPNQPQTVAPEEVWTWAPGGWPIKVTAR